MLSFGELLSLGTLGIPLSDFRQITGGIVARAAASDFRSFHHRAANLRVDVKIENVHIAALRTNLRGSRIAISQDMADDIIDTPEALFFHLLVICHEIAHLVHKHNEFGPQDRADSKNLEFWADFYSGKAFITLITYGRRLIPIVQRFYPGNELSFPNALEPVGKAVNRLVEKVYSDDPRYPPKLLRAGLICNGVTSALRHELVNVDPIWYFSVVKRLLLDSPALMELAVLHPNDAIVDKEQFDQIIAWHRKAQGDSPALTQGLKEQFLPYLHTTFNQTDEELAAGQRERLAELSAYYDLEADRVAADNVK